MEDQTASDADDKIRPTKAGKEYSGVFETAPENLSSDEEATIAETSISRVVSEEPFPFLQLPSEVRNVVYQHSCIYETPGSKTISDVLTFPGLGQAPITRVNKQIREETLPIFYGNHKFCIHIWMPTHPNEVDNFEELDIFLAGLDHFRHVWQMLHSFATAPAPTSTSDMQTSSFTFLTLLTFRADAQMSSEYDIAVLGFTMSSKGLICDKGNYRIETENLDWDRFSEVKKAYVSSICNGIRSALNDEVIPESFPDTRELVAKIDELVSLMFFMARQCPQLKSNVFGSVEDYDDLDVDIRTDFLAVTTRAN